MAGHTTEAAGAVATAAHGDRSRSPDPAWGLLYRAGALAAALAGGAYAAALVLLAATTAPPPSGGVQVLEFIATHRTVYIIRQLLWLTPSLRPICLRVSPFSRQRTTVRRGSGSWSM